MNFFYDLWFVSAGIPEIDFGMLFYAGEGEEDSWTYSMIYKYKVYLKLKFLEIIHF